jgi:hypothetical protein
MSDSNAKIFLHRYPLEPVLGMVLGVAFGWGLFGAGFGALAGYFVRVLRQQLFEGDPGADSFEDSAADPDKGDELLTDAYRVLGVSPESETAEIRKVYRNLAASFHPDGLSSFSEEQRKEAEEAFVRIRNAWEHVAAVRGVRS